MSNPRKLQGVRFLFGLVVAVACACFHAACGSRTPLPEAGTFSPQTTVSPSGACQLTLASAIPELPGALEPLVNGFIDEAAWDASTQHLRMRGWAAFDTGSPVAMLVVRDPFGLLSFATQPDLQSQERPDVAAAHSTRPDMLDSGFEMRVATVAGEPGPAAWVQCIEVYGVSAIGELTRLSRTGGRTTIGWNRRPDCFALTLVYSPPGFQRAGKRTGNLDSLEPGSAPGTVQLLGWADFDGGSTSSTMVLQLPESVAPASIVSHRWIPRPDVLEAIDPSRPELARSGFDIVLSISGSADELRKPDALRMWSIVDDNVPAPVSPGVLRR